MGARVSDKMETDRMNGNNNGTTSLVRIIKLQVGRSLKRLPGCDDN